MKGQDHDPNTRSPPPPQGGPQETQGLPRVLAFHSHPEGWQTEEWKGTATPGSEYYPHRDGGFRAEGGEVGTTESLTEGTTQPGGRPLCLPEPRPCRRRHCEPLGPARL